MFKSKKNLKIVLATTNIGKFKEFKKLLYKYPITILSQPDELNIPETGLTFAANARIKARGVAEATGSWALADDSGLCVKSLLGAPGVRSARYANNDSQRITRLLREMEPYKNREAFFSSALCLASPRDNILIEVESRCEGFIAFSPRGKNGFGYDPIFEIAELGLTFAEMDKDMKERLSHRAKAFTLLEPKLRELLGIF